MYVHLPTGRPIPPLRCRSWRRLTSRFIRVRVNLDVISCIVSGQDSATAVKVDSAANIYIVGSTQRALPGGGSSFIGDWDVFLAKFDEDGEQLWVRQFGTPYADEGLSLGLFEPNTTAAAGSQVQLVVTGYTKGYLNVLP